MDVLISVIVPVYNKAQYLHKCIESILRQSYSHLEIILVDDGSTDGSGELCDAYLSMDSRIKVIHRKNGGISAARNTGIKAATGEYLSFIDADDYWEPETYERFAKMIGQYHPDMLDCMLRYIWNGQVMPPQGHNHPKNCVLNRDYILKEIVPALTNLPAPKEKFILDYSCNKLFKTSIIRQNHISFNEKRRKWEDRPFVVECIAHCDTICCLPDVCYNYVGVEGSLASSFQKEIFQSVIENYYLYDRLFGNIYNYHTPEVDNIWFRKIHLAVYDIVSNYYDQNKQQIDEMLTRCFSDETVKNWADAWNPQNNMERRIKSQIEKQNFDDVAKFYLLLAKKDRIYKGWNRSLVARAMRKIGRLSRSKVNRNR